MKHRASPVAPVKNKDVSKRREWSSKDSCSRGANCAFRHRDQNLGQEKGENHQRTPIQAKKKANSEFRGRQPDRQKHLRRSTSVVRLFFKEEYADQVRMVPSSTSTKMRVARSHTTVKVTHKGIEQDEATLSRFSKMEKLHAEEKFQAP